MIQSQLLWSTIIHCPAGVADAVSQPAHPVVRQAFGWQAGVGDDFISARPNIAIVDVNLPGMNASRHA